MRKIKTDNLKVGQIFSAPVFTEGNNMFVPEMVPLRQKDIDLLIKLNIDFVISEGHAIKPEIAEKMRKSQEIQENIDSHIPEVPELPEDTIKEDTVKLEEADIFDAAIMADLSGIPQEKSQPETRGVIRFSISDVRQNSGPYRTYKSLIDRLNTVFASIKAGIDVQMSQIDHITTTLLQELNKNINCFTDFILGGEVIGNELAKSSVNTAILSALMALELKIPNHKINNIVTAALLHDVGMLRLSKGITEKKGGLSEAELEQIKSHPIHTSTIVTKELYGPREVNTIALQHHERWDGQGYPDRLTGTAIEIGARIISVADAFEAMVTKKSYRNSMVGYQAIKNLMADNSRRFDPAVIMAFTKIMGIYPIGSIVRLNDFSVARVVSINPEAPLRPVVQMLMDDKGKVFGSREVVTVDLLADKKLYIKNAIDPAEYNES